MPKRYLLVDSENLPRLDLASVADDFTVPFFFGASQRMVSKGFMISALKLGPRFVPIDIDGQGRNALDFHIAFYLGEYLAQDPAAECVILSGDKGFDPLIRHLVSRGFCVRRAAALPEALVSPHPAPASGRAAETTSTARRARAWLQKLPKPNRPRKRKGLVASMTAHFARKISVEEIEAVIEDWMRQGVVSEENGALSYSNDL